MIAPELPRAPSIASLPIPTSNSPMWRLRHFSAPCSTLPGVEGEVAAGIAVGHREHVDAVEFVAGRDHPAGARDQRPAQHRGGHVGGVGSGHGHARSLRSMGAQCLLRRNNAAFLACPASTL